MFYWEFFQIVETMSYSDNVANFMHVLGPFYEAVYDGQEPENLRRNPSPQPSGSESGTDKSDHLEDESGYSSSVNGTGVEEAGKFTFNHPHSSLNRRDGKSLQELERDLENVVLDR